MSAPPRDRAAFDERSFRALARSLIEYTARVRSWGKRDSPLDAARSAGEKATFLLSVVRPTLEAIGRTTEEMVARAGNRIPPSEYRSLQALSAVVTVALTKEFTASPDERKRLLLALQRAGEEARLIGTLRSDIVRSARSKQDDLMNGMRALRRLAGMLKNTEARIRSLDVEEAAGGLEGFAALASMEGGPVPIFDAAMERVVRGLEAHAKRHPEKEDLLVEMARHVTTVRAEAREVISALRYSYSPDAPIYSLAESLTAQGARSTSALAHGLREAWRRLNGLVSLLELIVPDEVATREETFERFQRYSE